MGEVGGWLGGAMAAYVGVGFANATFRQANQLNQPMKKKKKRGVRLV